MGHDLKKGHAPSGRNSGCNTSPVTKSTNLFVETHNNVCIMRKGWTRVVSGNIRFCQIAGRSPPLYKHYARYESYAVLTT